MTDFVDVKAQLDSASTQIVNVKTTLTHARDLLQNAVADLNAIQTTFTGLGADINTEAAANPSDVAWQNAKAEKDQIVTNFQALSTRASALLSAYDAVP